MNKETVRVLLKLEALGYEPHLNEKGQVDVKGVLPRDARMALKSVYPQAKELLGIAGSVLDLDAHPCKRCGDSLWERCLDKDGMETFARVCRGCHPWWGELSAEDYRAVRDYIEAHRG